MTDHRSDAWLSEDRYRAKAVVNVDARAQMTRWLGGLLGWFAEQRLYTHNSSPAVHGIHWTADGTWLLVTPTDDLGAPHTAGRGDDGKLRAALVWAPCPTEPPDVIRRLADPLPAGSAVPGIRPVTTEVKLARAPGWKADLARVNRELEDRRDYWEHRSLGIDAQRARVDTGWEDRIRSAINE